MANMDIILLERVDKLGGIGDVVSVKPGYARNFLLPSGKALRANETNKARFEADRERIEKENEEKRKTAEQDAQGLDGKQLVIIRQSSDSGQLYGSVTARDIAGMLSEDSHKIGKNQVTLAKPIKTLGVHEVQVALHPEVTLTIEANVARSADEAALQAQGIDVLADQAEEEAKADAEAQQALVDSMGGDPGRVAPLMEEDEEITPLDAEGNEIDKLPETSAGDGAGEPESDAPAQSNQETDEAKAG